MHVDLLDLSNDFKSSVVNNIKAIFTEGCMYCISLKKRKKFYYANKAKTEVESSEEIIHQNLMFLNAEVKYENSHTQQFKMFVEKDSETRRINDYEVFQLKLRFLATSDHFDIRVRIRLDDAKTIKEKKERILGVLKEEDLISSLINQTINVNSKGGTSILLNSLSKDIPHTIVGFKKQVGGNNK